MKFHFSGKELSGILLRANSIAIDDMADALMASADGRDLVKAIEKRKLVYFNGHGPVSTMKAHAAWNAPPKARKSSKGVRA